MVEHDQVERRWSMVVSRGGKRGERKKNEGWGAGREGEREGRCSERGGSGRWWSTIRWSGGGAWWSVEEEREERGKKMKDGELGGKESERGGVVNAAVVGDGGARSGGAAVEHGGQ